MICCTLESTNPNLERRFVLALLYFLTVNAASDWVACGYAGDPTDINCTDADKHDHIAWLSATDECQWYNFLCKNNSTVVICLPENNLNGTPLNELHHLRELELIKLHSNQLKGTIPTYLGKVTELKSFEVHKNGLVGTIPKEMYRLKILQRLNLGDNNLVETISMRVGNLAELGGLYLYETSLTRTLEG